MKLSTVIRGTDNPNKEEENICILVLLSEGLLFLPGCFYLYLFYLWFCGSNTSV